MVWKNSSRGRLLTISEESPLLGCARQTIYNAIHSGAGEPAQHPHYRVGRSIRFAEEEINTFLGQRCTVQPVNLRWRRFPPVVGKEGTFHKKVKGRCFMRQEQ